MDDKKGNIILGIILAILMIIAIAIVIINPNKVETVNYAKEQGNTNSEEVTANTNKTNNEELEKEEKQKSMQEGKTFCKIGKTGVIYEDKNKSIYAYNVEDGTTKKITNEDVKYDTLADGRLVYKGLPGEFERKVLSDNGNFRDGDYQSSLDSGGTPPSDSSEYNMYNSVKPKFIVSKNNCRRIYSEDIAISIFN